MMGGRSLDDSDNEDEDDERLQPRNCGFYNPKLGKNYFSTIVPAGLSV